MTEDVQLVLEDVEEKMQKAIDHLANELATIRAGKANPHVLDMVTVDYYGAQTPLTQVANVSTPDAKTIAVQPWEKAMINPIERAIINGNLGLTPINNGDIIRINVPPLTEERRKQLVKQVSVEAESARVSIRAARREGIEDLKQLQKEGLSEDETKTAEEDVQKKTDGYTHKVEEMVKKKEADIMTI